MVEIPALSRDIGIRLLFFRFPAFHPFFTHEMNFDEYFSFEAILGDLIRWRIKGRDVDKTLPARKDWKRAGIHGRKKMSSADVRWEAIRRTVKRLSKNGSLADLRWGRALLELVKDVQGRVTSGNITFDPPRIMNIVKSYKHGEPAYRQVASFDKLVDRVVLSRTTAYVRDRLENVLSGNCYSFRCDSSITHRTAVGKLQQYRTRFASGSLFVGECDIEKFFDSISHEVVREKWAKMGFDPMAGNVLNAYLDAYPVQPNEQQDVGGSGVVRRGLPQGGSLSTVLANLVLSGVDDAVARVNDGRLFYARFCDDVVFVHPDEMACRRAMEVYAAALKKLNLPMHPVKPFVYKPVDGNPTTYYEIKSKGPFRWRSAKPGEKNCAPWLSFLGCQIRFDGETRVRKESIEKHIRALGHETAKAVREIAGSNLRGDAARRWFNRFRSRLIAKGVGYVTAKVDDCRMCWAGAFPNVTPCADTKMQMRRLDRVREGMLAKVWRSLPEQSKRGCFRYRGRPYSYFGFLEKIVRPTGGTRRRTLPLSYSEL